MGSILDEAIAAAYDAVHNDHFDAKEACQALLAALREMAHPSEDVAEADVGADADGEG